MTGVIVPPPVEPVEPALPPPPQAAISRLTAPAIKTTARRPIEAMIQLPIHASICSARDFLADLNCLFTVANWRNSTLRRNEYARGIFNS
jgi:hypothetical protein